MKRIEKDVLAEAVAGVKVQISEESYAKFDEYADFLIEYNEKVNLTAITEPKEIAIKHFADSVAILNFVKIKDGARLIDVGCGAGFPSVPLKIARDDLKITLLDSLNKRIVFLEELCEKLGIKAETVHGRAEDVGKLPKYREKYDVATARAVAGLPELAEYCLPFVKVGGVFAAMKGPDPGDEIKEAEKAIEILGGKIKKVEKYSLSDGSGRSVIIIEKMLPTPSKYPRPAAKIAKAPLSAVK